MYCKRGYFHFGNFRDCVTKMLHVVQVFSAPEPKVQVYFALLWSCVVRGPSVRRLLSHFRLLLWNCCTEFNETWQGARSHYSTSSTKFVFFGPIGKKEGGPSSDWLRHFRLLLWMSFSLLVFYVTCNDISVIYVMAHWRRSCTYSRALNAIDIWHGSLTCPSYTDTGPPFLYGDSNTSPHLVAFYDTLGIRRMYSWP